MYSLHFKNPVETTANRKQLIMVQPSEAQNLQTYSASGAYVFLGHSYMKQFLDVHV